MQILKSVKYLQQLDKLTRNALNKLNNSKGWSKERSKTGRDKEKQEKSASEKQQEAEIGKEAEKKWTEEIEIEREKAANSDVGKASGRALGDLDKIENSATSLPEENPSIEEDIEDIKENRGIEKEKEQENRDVERSFEEKIGEKKIEKILEEGKPEEGKSWVDKVRPNQDQDLEFQSLESEESKTQTINFLKDDVSSFSIPEIKDNVDVPLEEEDKEKIIELLHDENRNIPEELQKEAANTKPRNEYKTDAFQATRKTQAELREMEEATFADEVYMDGEVLEFLEGGNDEEDINPEMEMDGDMGGMGGIGDD
jgi:hypothetical protein